MKVLVNNDNDSSNPPSEESSYTPSNQNKRRKHERLDKVSSQIVIVGSGLGGLSAARSLELAGFQNIRILEQRNSDPQSREGYGLTLTYNPQGPLAYLGILEEVAQNDCPSRSHYTFDPDGHVLGYYGNAFRPEGGRGQRGNLRVPRMLVRNILRQHVQSPILYGKQVAAVEVQSSSSVTLRLNDGSQLSNIDLVIAADGIRSSVLKSILPPEDTKSALQSLGIFVILGIADFCHPLVDERGFYTLDGHHRLFTMPYEGSRISTNQRRRVMWQLSFPTVDYANDDISKNNNIYDDVQSLLFHRHDSTFLREQALKRCQGWHDPVLPMIRATPLETIWGTLLMDRDPQNLMKSLLHHYDNPSSTNCIDTIIPLGDAMHPMSPFKGAGANQALLDGPLLAKWLQRASVHSACRGFLREMTQRTRPRVLASRDAAAILHSPSILQSHHNQQDEKNGNDDNSSSPYEINNTVLKVLRQKNIGAHLGSDLDRQIAQVMIDLQNVAFPVSSNPSLPKDSAISGTCTNCHPPPIVANSQDQALDMASRGDTPGLRCLTLQYNTAVAKALDPNGRTCLHLAALGGHGPTCQWLLTEVFLAPDSKDHDGNTPCDLAPNDAIREILQSMSYTNSLH